MRDPPPICQERKVFSWQRFHDSYGHKKAGQRVLFSCGSVSSFPLKFTRKFASSLRDSVLDIRTSVGHMHFFFYCNSSMIEHKRAQIINAAR